MKNKIVNLVVLGIISAFIIIIISLHDKNHIKGDDTISQYKNYEFRGVIDNVFRNTSVRNSPYVKLTKGTRKEYPIPEKMFNENKYKRGDSLIKNRGDSILILKRNDEVIETYDYLLRIKRKRTIENYQSL